MRSPFEVSEAVTQGQGSGAGAGVRLVKLPAEKPQAAAAFLRERSRGVMDLIAHFWERLSATPPLSRRDLHLITALAVDNSNIDININKIETAAFSGAMLYVPKAHRADVLALDERIAEAFAAYIGEVGKPDGHAPGTRPPPSAGKFQAPAGASAGNGAGHRSAGGAGYTLTDLSGVYRGPGASAAVEAASEMTDSGEPGAAAANGRAAIDFLTGDAQGIRWMTHLLLPMVHRRAPARELVNVVMRLPPEAACAPEANVRLARDTDIPVLNRWRRQYKDERGILFDADMDAWVEHQRVFVYESPVEGAASARPAETEPATGVAAVAGTVVAAAKIDLDLQDLVEIGGVYTFPEYRHRGFGAAIVRDLAHRIRQMNKTPTLQVDERNSPALRLYMGAGWREMGRLARVWLTG